LEPGVAQTSPPGPPQLLSLPEKALSDFRHAQPPPLGVFLIPRLLMLRAFLVALTLSAIVPALAQDVDPIKGHYSGHGEGELTVDLSNIEDDRYAISINTVTPMENDIPGCGGGIEGEVLLSQQGGNFFVENEYYDPAGGPLAAERYCEIGLEFDGQGGLKIEERNGCVGYHGAACGFTGTLLHDAAGL